MAEIWENRDFQSKISRLNPDLRDRFVRFLKTMYDKESEMMLRFIGESRHEMTETAKNIHEEQEELREMASRIGRASRMSMDDPHHTLYSPTDSIFAEAVDTYLNEHEEDDFFPEEEEEVIELPPEPPRRELTSSGPEEMAKMQEESLEVVKNMSGYNVKIENERERQTERVEKMKNQVKKRKEARENLAMELLDLAQGIEENRKKDKEEQQARLKERLEEMKKKRQDGEPEPEQATEEEEKKKKKKEKKEKKEKKKKKDKDGDDTVIEMGDDGVEHEKKKKKKKKKDKNDEEAPDGAAADS